MCMCDPAVKAPYCGRGECRWPEQPRPSPKRVVDLIEPGTRCQLEYVNEDGAVLIRAVWDEIAAYYGRCLFSPVHREILDASFDVLLEPRWQRVTEWTNSINSRHPESEQ